MTQSADPASILREKYEAWRKAQIAVWDIAAVETASEQARGAAMRAKGDAWEALTKSVVRHLPAVLEELERLRKAGGT